MEFKELWEKFDKDILTEDVKTAIVAMIDTKVTELTEAYDVKVEKLTESIGVAMDTVEEELKNKQKELVVDAVKLETADAIIENHKEYIEKFGITAEVIDKDKELKGKYDELKESYNAIQTKLTDSENATKSANRVAKYVELAEGLTTIQKENLDVLSESIEFDDKFEDKINKFKELITKKPVVDAVVVEPEVIISEAKSYTM